MRGWNGSASSTSAPTDAASASGAFATVLERLVSVGPPLDFCFFVGGLLDLELALAPRIDDKMADDRAGMPTWPAFLYDKFKSATVFLSNDGRCSRSILPSANSSCIFFATSFS